MSGERHEGHPYGKLPCSHGNTRARDVRSARRISYARLMSTLPPQSTPPAAAPDHDALPPGTRFGEFEIHKVVGVGGFGIVYQAWDHSLERQVALKEYMPASLAARGAGPQITVRSASFAETYAIGLRSFVNEARLLARFDHPSLVKVYRFWEDNATAYMVMPFLQGTTLRDTRRRMAHPPDEAWIRSVIAPILAAIELLHREGVYHRDIAPDNILLQNEGPPILLDFGAARRVISDRTQSLTAILKPSYAPIEQYAEMAQMRQGPWTDLYALGAVIHYLLFGAPPPPATARAVQDDSEALENRVVPGVSPRFMEAMAWMLAVRPNQRPQSGEELRRVLDGNASPPPRGRAGITIPPNVANPGGGAAGTWPPPGQTTAAPGYTQQPTYPQPAQQPPAGYDATRVNTAHHPTHLPTAQMPTAQMPPPGAAPRTGGPAQTGFGPTAQMPTARPPQQTTQAMPPRAPMGQTLPPHTTQHTTSFPPQQPPPYPPPPQPPHGGQTQPPHGRATGPVPLAAAAPSPSPQSSKAFVVIGGIVALLVVGGALGWQFLGKRDTASASADAAASAAAAAAVASAALPMAAPAVATPPAVAAVDPAATAAASAPVATPTTAMPQPVPVPVPVPAATTPPTTTATPAATALSTPPLTGTPVPPRNATITIPGSTGTTGSPTPSTTAGPATRPEQRPQALGTPALQQQGSRTDGNAAQGYPTNERPRPLGMPPPRDGTPVPSAQSMPSGTPTTGPYGRPLPPTSAGNAATPPPAAHDESNARTVSEACGRRVFIALALCIEEKCEEPRWRNTGECIPVLERKARRQGG